MELKQQNGHGTRQLILATAMKLVAKNGYAGTSISMICREAGLSASSLYWFFENKEDLFLCAIKDGAEEFLRAAEAPIPQNAAAPEELREALIKTVAHRLEHNAHFLRLLLIMMLEDQNLSIGFREKIAEIRAGSLAWWKNFLVQMFLPLGETTAAILAADFAPFCRSAINGAFIAQQYGEPVDVEGIMRQLTLLMVALVEKIERER